MRRLLLIPLLPLFVACGDDEGPMEPAAPPPPAPTVGTISGTVSIPAGVPGTAGNSRVALYADFADWQADRVLRQVAAGSDGSYAFSNMAPGTYYLDSWKDNNVNGLFDSGGFFGVFGSGSDPDFVVGPMDVAAGQTVTISVGMIVIP